MVFAAALSSLLRQPPPPTLSQRHALRLRFYLCDDLPHKSSRTQPAGSHSSLTLPQD
jgi:hypothetical protein